MTVHLNIVLATFGVPFRVPMIAHRDVEGVEGFKQGLVVENGQAELIRRITSAGLAGQ